MRFLLFCEGETETKALPSFFKRWLDERLCRPVGVTPVKFAGWRNLRDEVAKKAHLRLREDDVIAVISLLDLYGPTFYPEHLATAMQKYDWARGAIEKEVGSDRFRQFFAVHEVEAWLLSDPSLFPREIRTGFPGKIATPEEVDFGEHPSKLLDKLYTDRVKRSYKKVTQGRELFERLDPDLARTKCPHLAEMLDEMLALAKGAGL